MIPTEKQAKAFWEKYNLPIPKQVHMQLVCDVAIFLGRRLKQVDSSISINEHLLSAAALTHDLDKNIPGLPGENHPQTGVRILREEGMDEVADLVKNHSLHSILHPDTAPKSWEEKLLFLADKMVKQDIITVDKRFKLWNDEHVPQDQQEILNICYPKVKELEADIFMRIGINPDDVSKLLTG